MLEGSRRYRTIDLLRDILSFDSGVFEHCVRVKNYALLVANQLDMNDDELTDLQQAAVLHDYGKIYIPKPILYKTAPLSKDEYKIMQLHASLGFDALSGVHEVPDNVLQYIREHHERLDGSGYPDGKTYVSVPGQLIAMSDVYDAVTHKRCYKRAYSKEYALALIGENKNAFNEGLIHTFQKTLAKTDDDDVISCYDDLLGYRFGVCQPNEWSNKGCDKDGSKGVDE